MVYECYDNYMSNRVRNKTKGLIALAVYALMFKKDYDDISVKEICERAGISRMSFYRYYSKKDDIFVDYCDDRFEEFYEETHRSNDLPIREFTYRMFAFIQKYKRQLKILKKANREFMLLNQLNNYARYLVANLKNAEVVERKNNPLFAPFVAGGLFNILMIWIDSEDQNLTPELLNTMLYDIIPSKR